MYCVLGATILAGLVTTVLTNLTDYRETVAPWFHSVFSLRPDTAPILEAPFGFQLHANSPGCGSRSGPSPVLRVGTGRR